MKNIFRNLKICAMKKIIILFVLVLFCGCKAYYGDCLYVGVTVHIANCPFREYEVLNDFNNMFMNYDNFKVKYRFDIKNWGYEFNFNYFESPIQIIFNNGRYLYSTDYTKVKYNPNAKCNEIIVWYKLNNYNQSDDFTQPITNKITDYFKEKGVPQSDISVKRNIYYPSFSFN